MARIRTLREKLEAAAPLTTAPGAPVENRRGLYLVALDHGVRATVEAREGRWIASVPLGPAPDRNRGEVFAAMLAYNGLWRETGGGRIELDGPEGDVILMGDVPEGAEAAALARLLDMLTTVGAAWRRFLARQSASSDGAGRCPADAAPIH